MTIKITKEEFEKAIVGITTMAEGALKTNLHFSTFKRYAEKFKVYIPNQGGKGKRKPKVEGKGKTSLKEILDGQHPTFPTGKLKQKLYDAGLKINRCEECGIEQWNEKPIVCELHHRDGNRFNHALENLEIVCPNCHSQTTTFRFKKR